MTRIFSFILLCFFLQLFYSCGTDQADTRTIKFSHEIDSLIKDTASVSYAVDSLKKEVRKAKNDSATINQLAELGQSWRKKELLFANEVMRLSKEQHYRYGIIDANARFGAMYERLSDFKRADSVLSLSLNEANAAGFTKLQSQALYMIGDMYRLQNSNDSALLFFEKSKSIAIGDNDQSRVATCLNAMGETYRNKSQYAEATKCLEEALAIAIEINDKERISKCLGGLGSIYRAQGNFPKALDYSKQSLAIARSMKDKKVEATALGTIGALYFQQKDYKTALTYFNMALKLGEELKDNIRIIFCQLTIGAVYDQQAEFKTGEEKKAEYKKAYQHYEEAYVIAKRINNKDYLSYALSAMGDVDRVQGNYDEALKKNLEAIEIAREIGNKNYVITDLYNSASVYAAMGDTAAAIKAGEESLNLAKEEDLRDDIKKAADFLAALYHTIGNDKKAYELHVLYSQMKDSVLNEEGIRQFASMEFKEKEEEYKTEKVKSDETLKREKLIRNGFIGGSIIFAILAVVILFSLVRNKRAKKIIEKQKTEVEEQKNLVEEKQKEILDSINYAKRLQAAILPPVSQIEKIFPESFVIYYPKDIVAGDFYWMETIGDFIFIAAADSTGHGVPGAMVSVVCSNALNQAVKEFRLSDPGMILDKVTEIVLETFARSEENVSDGMDISLLAINKKTKQALWSGANNPLWYFEEGQSELTEIKADKQPVGLSDLRKPFTTHRISLESKKIFYLLTDGFADQFGGPKGKKFKYKQLKSLLLSVAHQTLKEQASLISQSFIDWKSCPDENGRPKDLEQVDDMTVLGIRI